MPGYDARRKKRARNHHGHRGYAVWRAIRRRFPKPRNGRLMNKARDMRVMEWRRSRCRSRFAITDAGVPAGIISRTTPQSVNAARRLRRTGQGEDAQRLLERPLPGKERPAFSVVLSAKCPLAACSSEKTIPTIGIGAGRQAVTDSYSSGCSA